MIDVARQVQELLDPHGLIVRGSLNFSTDAPLMAGGMPAASAMLIGCVGDAHWAAFERWRNDGRHTLEHPLDDWSKSIINPIANRLDGQGVFPSDPPFQPFQQWAMQAEGLRASPLGMLIHPDFGLWHSYRGAILFADLTLSQVPEKLSHPCDSCIEKPCLSACPVSAFTQDGYDVISCLSYIRVQQDQSCMDKGCRARVACPIGRAHQHGPDQAQFHMLAFAK